MQVDASVVSMQVTPDESKSSIGANNTVTAGARKVSHYSLIDEEKVQNNYDKGTDKLISLYPYLKRVPTASEWWGLLCVRQSEREVKQLYMNELSSLMIVQSLIAGFTFSSIVTITPDQEIIERGVMDLFTILLYMSFLSSLTSIFFLMISLAQLNIRITPRSVSKYFMDPKTSQLPLCSALLTIVTITLVLAASFVYAYGTQAKEVFITVIIYGSVIFIWAFRAYAQMNAMVLEEFEILRNESKIDTKSDLYRLFEENHISLYFAEIVAQEIYTIGHLKEVVKLMTLAEFMTLFAVTAGAAIKIYNILEQYESIEEVDERIRTASLLSEDISVSVPHKESAANINHHKKEERIHHQHQLIEENKLRNAIFTSHAESQANERTTE
jgi:hypothetical protein